MAESAEDRLNRLLSERHIEQFQPTEADIEVVRLYAAINLEKSSMASMNIQKLIDLLILDYRKQNDNATIRMVLRNQGRIAAFMELKEIITREMPVMNKVPLDFS